MTGAALPDLTMLFVLAVFVLAGLVKGVIGLGLPTIAMGLLATVMAPIEAAALLLLPSLVTNVWQAVAGPALAPLLRRLWPLLAGVCAGTWAGVGVMTGSGARYGTMLLGVALALYAITGLAAWRPRLHAARPRLHAARPRLHAARHSIAPSGFIVVEGRPMAFWDREARLAQRYANERLLGPLAGAVTGAITAATGVFVIPAVPYLQAIGLEKEDLVQALGLSFTVSTLALAVNVGIAGRLDANLAGPALAALAMAGLGMWLGQAIRLRLSPLAFRRGFFVGLAALGVYLVARSL